MRISPELHSLLLALAVLSGLLFCGVILARNPKSTPARLHAIYGAAVSWWFFCMAMLASADGAEQARLWQRLLHLGVGSLPGIAYHLNVSTAGVAHEYRRGVRIHYALSAAVVVFCLLSPDLLAEPGQFSWGFYPRYTYWGLVPVLPLVVMFPEVMRVYGTVMRRSEPGSQIHARARAFHHGNCFATLALVDFLPAFGVAVYPFGFAVLTFMQFATIFGAVRYRLIEITPELAAERILATIPDGLLVTDSQGLVRVANGAAARLLGRPVGELVEQPLASVVADEALREAFRTPAAKRPAEVSFRLESGASHVVGLSGSVLRDLSGRSIAVVWLLRDLSDQRLAEQERQRLESWLQQTQKLETVGVMAAGIAHDFNNILTAILGSAEMARRELAPGAPAHVELGRIANAVERAAELTRQLLTFSGRGPTPHASLDLNAAVREMAELMHAAISGKATLRLELSEPLPRVIGDASELGQVILNLITNASEALGDAAGSITLRTRELGPDPELPELTAMEGSAAATRRVLLEVSDTGKGMDAATRARIFDPFFTTKFTGRGLGLATVMGIVKRHGGLIDVASEPGAGARFRVMLPAADEQGTHAPVAQATDRAWRGSGLALLADDEGAVRRVARQMLSDRGFEVLEAADGAEAVAIFRARRAEIEIVVLDVAMPVMTGWEAFAEIRALSPEVPVLFISGYSEPEGVDAISDAGVARLQKPFRLAAFSEAIRILLERRTPARRASDARG